MVLRRQDTMLCNLGSMRFQPGRKRYSSPSINIRLACVGRFGLLLSQRVFERILLHITKMRYNKS